SSINSLIVQLLFLIQCLFHFINVRFLPFSTLDPFSDSFPHNPMNHSNQGNFSNSPFTFNTTNIIDVDDSDNYEDQVMAGFPSLAEIKRIPAVTSELYDHITSLDEQLVTL
ncbi:hypothetical protein TorRG33x02_352910, partial [Trema orientale]